MAHVLIHLLISCSLLIKSTFGADDEDPFDLSFYTKGAAIGDSYAAGIGAGNELAWNCARYDASYANLVALQLGVDDDKLDFTYKACSGALVPDIHKQAESLSSDQEFVMVSAGGNDAQLTSILNACVYSFYGPLVHPSCQGKLDEALAIIQSNEFASSLDDLIELVKSKLTSSGKVYYTGYARFFDESDAACDKVSWHVWVNIFNKEPLTQHRRRMMNEVVLAMNKALRLAVERAGPSVHFIDYDSIVQSTHGTFCQPSQDESRGRGANRRELFFYQMWSRDTPLLEKHTHDDLKRRQSDDDNDDILPANGTLREFYGTLIQDAIKESIDDGDDEYAALNDENANLDLQQEVEDELDDQVGSIEEASVAPAASRYVAPQSLQRTKSPWNFTFAEGSSKSQTQDRGRHVLGSKVSFADGIDTASFATQSTHSRFSNSTAFSGFTNATKGSTVNDTKVGTVIANKTHVLLGSGQPVQMQAFNVKKLFVSDLTFRVFHPTQAGHAIIANLILFQMAQDNAERLGLEDAMPPEQANTTGEGWPELPGAACNMDSTSTWSDRDAMRSALNEFCSDFDNVHGSTGQMTSGTYNSGFDYMNISIKWDSDNGVISEHGCMSWLDVVMDGCNVPKEGGSNFKHGGTIDSNYPTVDATLKIEPLVMRKIWNGYEGDDQKCNPVDTNQYIDQGTLQSNIDTYCKESARTEIAESGYMFEQTYNDGTPSRVILKTEWPQGPRNYQVFWDECQYYMSVINNGCSMPGDQNKMNWKHGGSITDKNGIKYTIEPTQKRPPPPDAPFGTCKAPFRGLFYSITVTGAGHLSSDWGKGLHKEFKNCGATTAWSFKYYDEPAEDGTEWEAFGRLPTFISDHCAKRAVDRAAGFSNKGQC